VRSAAAATAAITLRAIAAKHEYASAWDRPSRETSTGQFSEFTIPGANPGAIAFARSIDLPPPAQSYASLSMARRITAHGGRRTDQTDGALPRRRRSVPRTVIGGERRTPNRSRLRAVREG
jgi:hypothetical protein